MSKFHSLQTLGWACPCDMDTVSTVSKPFTLQTISKGKVKNFYEDSQSCNAYHIKCCSVATGLMKGYINSELMKHFWWKVKHLQ